LTLAEIGLEYAYDLYQAILAAGGAQPVVVDSDNLITDPGRDHGGLLRRHRHSVPPIGPALVTRRA
jgi:hypothetical protein